MKLKLLALAIGISFLNIMCCGSNQTAMTFEYLPTGRISFVNQIDKYSVVKDSIKGPFDVYFDFDTKQVYTFNYSIIPMAMACTMHSPFYTNTMNREKLAVSIDNDFVYKDDAILGNSNIMDLDSSSYKYLFYNGGQGVRFDEKFLYYAKFNKGWTTFTIAGELEDGQPFKFEKRVFLGL